MRAVSLSFLVLACACAAQPRDPGTPHVTSAALALQDPAAPPDGTTATAEVTLGEMAEALPAAIQGNGFDCVIQILPKGDVAALVAGGYQADLTSGDLIVELRNLATAYDIEEGSMTPFDAKELKITNIDSAAHTADVFLGTQQITPTYQGASQLPDERPALFVREPDNGTGTFHLVILYEGVRTQVRFVPQAAEAPISEE